jgi:hypothetical protein
MNNGLNISYERLINKHCIKNYGSLAKLQK